ncbi:hypothetical protein F2P79_010242 [Pimephales promelas]|nr:hypothetical protein F2P79_010242 [Pimephales promelas]
MEVCSTAGENYSTTGERSLEIAVREARWRLIHVRPWLKDIWGRVESIQLALFAIMFNKDCYSFETSLCLRGPLLCACGVDSSRW